ncbi:hypothetical protein NEOKW01_2036 [Nematocida sp. AWRm80]|nr:hypothetical protein NEOKW01_2036 [Nematocida sp. AWRm80]
MECKWGNCQERFNDQKDFTLHVSKHIRGTDIRGCHWRDCPKQHEKKLSKGTLITHIRMHTREKPFKCTQCSKEYSRADALNKHYKLHDQLAADKNIQSKKLSYLLLLQQETEIALNSKQQEYKKLMVENDTLLKYICSTLGRYKKRQPH